ncbi:DUF4149 domain-containing protein [Glaciecola sp. XM2]|jgi:hypothetical protein|uniref:DUF4149 domain-containing protein n=1 Tax=Glaciecola sp. XM2 TaxID=1914931 RepID=UPI001BDF1C77|nr:DUF4149 domain-containing protein [Glaciecola sp. XM2]MBT1450590.1 DUF4149 domain-containing protein [Glaciecola sp. XM2]
MLEYIQILIVSIILGGMLTFQFLFAPLIFIKLPSETARPFIRKFFPFYYLYFGLLAIVLSILSYYLVEQDYGYWLLAAFSFTALLFFVSRQIFMPLANKASDEERKSDFTRHHRTTVGINTLQLLIMLVALWLLT